MLFFVLRTHLRQVVASGGELKARLEDIRDGLREELESSRDAMGLNYVGLGFVEGMVREKRVARLEDVDAGRGDEGRRKRAFVDVS
ncbi:MAG: hypothetical protein INR71_07290 [Terriglobus roseus]|nr:hypothetical protein [Terriglobus roseus]